MSDLLLGTIIGGAIGVIGSVLALVIQGYFSRTTTRMQIDARVEEQKKQFEYQKEQAQIERSISIRGQYLKPISQHLQSITKSAHDIESKLRDLTMLCGDDENIAWLYTGSRTCLDDMVESVNSISGHMDSIEIVRVENTDSQLASLIQKTIMLGVQVSQDVYELLNMRIRHGEGDFSDKPKRQTSSSQWLPLLIRPSDMSGKPNKQIAYQCTDTLAVINAFFESIRQSNQRIEEVLSGKE